MSQSQSYSENQGILPFRQFILKVHSRCDLACDHCYVYEHADQSWRGRPKDGISAETAAQAARRIADHARDHALPEVHVILHGGEPLLLGVSRTREVVEVLRREISPVTDLVLRMHTNGVLLSEEFLDLFVEYDVKIGVSLDGDRQANDLHRLDRRGQSSFDRVIAALTLLRKPAYRHLYSGLLCTIDLQNDSLEAYRALLEQEPPRIDFLLPHATWEHQPFGLAARRDPARAKDGSAPYAQWLGDIFDLWDETGRPVPIRTFDSVLASLHGRPSGTESLGLVPADLLVIETDGSLEQADWLKTAFEGAAATGFDVFQHELDEAAAHAGIMARQHGLDDLCDTCRACPVVAICGGGLYAHRYDPASGFNNPSVYCPDLVDLIGRINQVERGQNTVSVVQAADVEGASTSMRYVFSEADFDALASGRGSVEGIRALADAELSVVRKMLARLAWAGPQDDRSFTAGWDRLATLDEKDSPAVDWVMTHPYVRVWAARCLEDLTAGRSIGDAGHMAAIAASAYLRAGSSTVLTLPVRDGLVHLPGSGALYVAADASSAVVEIVSDELIAVSVGGQTRKIGLTGPDAGRLRLWLPARRLQAEGLTVGLEDLDPHRDCHPRTAGRQTAAECERWQGTFAEAMAFVSERLPEYAAALNAGLTTLVPLAPSADGESHGATSRHAFGAIGSALPKDPAMLALVLLRGFQQVKLGALIDLFALYDVADAAAQCRLSWRSEPQPLGDVLQEAYAYIAVTDFWRARMSDVPRQETAATEANFARSRARTVEAVDSLLGSGSLTAVGERFVRAIAATAAAWSAVPVSREAENAVRAMR